MPGFGVAFTTARAYRGVPDVDALIEGAAGQVLAVGAEGHAVHGLLVLGQRVDANASLHVPQPHRGVKRSTGKRVKGCTFVNKNVGTTKKCEQNAAAAFLTLEQVCWLVRAVNSCGI